MKSPELTAAKRTAREFVDRFPFVDAGLLFVGDSGLGKTHLACAILAELIATKGVRGLYVDSSSLLNRIAASFRSDAEAPRETVLSPYMGAELLVLDEIGVTPPHPWVTDVLYDLLNTRYNGKKTTIVTTNYAEVSEAPSGPKVALEDRIGYRNLSRLYEMCLMVPLRGDDYRKVVLRAQIRSGF
jgi:DNA replication protein DnaC